MNNFFWIKIKGKRICYQWNSTRRNVKGVLCIRRVVIQNINSNLPKTQSVRNGRYVDNTKKRYFCFIIYLKNMTV